MKIDSLGNITLDDDPERNYISIDHEDFYLISLSKKGASSNLFILHDPNGDTEDRAIKICKSPFIKYGRDKRLRRFMREIRAFRIAKKNNCTSVIKFYKSGVIPIGRSEYPFIIMEKAESDLANYLESNQFNFTINQKLAFCVNILTGVKQLHEQKIYHRDI